MKSTKEKNNEQKIKSNELPTQVKNIIKINFVSTYQKLIRNKKDVVKLTDLERWKNNILSIINSEIDKLFEINVNTNKESVKKNNEIYIKKEIKIENNTEMNMFTPKDIQEENKEITRNFQNEAFSYMNTNEKVENENVARFLRLVAIISRVSYKQREELNNKKKEEYLKSKGNNINMKNEEARKDFSRWVKNLEKQKGKKIYESSLSQINLFENEDDNKEQKFLYKLFSDLSIMYFHCKISFPKVEIKFDTEVDFNYDIMTDFINRGKNRKVNFVILPSLFYNGNYIQNGKFWVFTFYKETFRFDDSIKDELAHYLKQEKQEKISIQYIKKNFQILSVRCSKLKNNKRLISVETNFDIPDNFNYNFVFYIPTKYGIHEERTKIKNFEIDNYKKLIGYAFELENETLFSSSSIIYEN